MGVHQTWCLWLLPFVVIVTSPPSSSASSWSSVGFRAGDYKPSPDPKVCNPFATILKIVLITQYIHTHCEALSHICINPASVSSASHLWLTVTNDWFPVASLARLSLSLLVWPPDLLRDATRLRGPPNSLMIYTYVACLSNTWKQKKQTKNI